MVKDDIIYIPIEKINIFLMDTKINFGSDSFSVFMLKELLNDPYYEKIKKLLKKESSEIMINVKTDDEDFQYERFTASNLIRALESLIFTEEISDKEFDRILSLRDFANYDRFIQNYKDKALTLFIENVRYRIRYIDIIKLISLSDEEYRIVLNERMKAISGVPKTMFMYAVNHIMDSHDFQKKYAFPQSVTSRLKSIRKCEDVDIEAINTFLSTDDSKLSKISISKELEREVFDGIQDDFTQLEKAIYIYIKLCKTLTYDPFFFALDQKGTAAETHENIQRISRITPKNNRVVCYELNAIYGYFLNKLGINYISSDSNNENYGGGHAKLRFRVDKFLVSADAVKSVLDGDMVRCKIGAELNGLNVLNNNQKTRDEFNLSVEKVYKLICDKTNRRDNLLRKYRDTLMIDNLSIYEKLEFVIEKVNKKKLASLDNLGYLLRLKRSIFSRQEMDDEFSLVIMRYVNNESISLRVVFSLQDSNGYYSYYLYQPNGELQPTTRDELIEALNSGKLEYLERHIDEIPNVCMTKGITKKKYLNKK